MNATPRLLQKLSAFSGWALLIALLLLPLVIYAASQMKIGAADVHAWLPEGRPVRQRYEEFVREFGLNQAKPALIWSGN